MTLDQAWAELKHQITAGREVDKSLMHDPRYTEGRETATAYKKGRVDAADSILEEMFILELKMGGK